jgi:hypothetical protein
MRAALLMLTGAALLFAGGERCENCHEIAPTVKQWRMSSHRNVDCEKCHGGTFQSANVQRLIAHTRGNIPEQIRLKFVQVKEIVERCKSCHQQEFAEWSNGPHGAAYSKIFLDEKHNTKRMLMDDCLRCHGMFFDGGVSDLVAPVANKGPWKMVRKGMDAERTIPCLACHSIHTDGEPHTKTDLKRGMRPSLAFWDRRSGEHIRAAELPVPAVREGERLVKMSPDKRQALCYQCHAPWATGQAWSGDDRTPLAVHEGLSCLACHQRHGEDARASCANCHPRLSNCGLDVEKMDTSFANPKSRHNVHTVKCVDCHEKGVPKKLTAQR